MSLAAYAPPANVEAEQGIFGSILIDPDVLHEVVPILRADDFYRDAHQILWEAVAGLYGDGERVDPTLLAEQLKRDDTLARIGGVDYLAECCQSVPHAANAAYYAGIVREHAIRRQLIDAAHAMLKEAYGLDHTASDTIDRATRSLLDIGDDAHRGRGEIRRLSEGITQALEAIDIRRQLIDAAHAMLKEAYGLDHTAGETIDRATRSLLDIGDDAQRGRGEIRRLSEGIAQALEAIDVRRQGESFGVETGLPALDEMLCGLRAGSLTIIGARPGKGKSALAVNVLTHAAINQGVPSLMFSLEMALQEFGQRFLSSVGKVSAFAAQHPRKLDDVSYARFRRRLEAIASQGKEAPIFVDDTCGRTVTEIVAITRRAIARHQVGLVVIDYLQLCESENSREPRHEQVSKISRRLKTLARDSGIPVIALSQLNRTSEDRADQKPRLADLRESGAIEQDADNVLLIHHPDPEHDDAEIIVAKARNGPTGTIKVYFRREIGRAHV